ncbi:MAG: 2-amino-4-hydroxy-6-hydroxymethyldihydropteridine diphosphokinase [Candidatus Neomarinimicrobiota bacterium]
MTAYLGLGSNLGRRKDNLARAIRLFSGSMAGGSQKMGETSPVSLHQGEMGCVRPTRGSSLYETSPWGYAGQPDFLNLVLEVRTTSSPTELLESAKALEKEMGREPGIRYGPRLIDVDILLYGDLVFDEPGLQIPHPRLHQRMFVLAPLEELAPGLMHPTLRLTIEQLAHRADGQEGVKLWGPPPYPTHSGDAGPVDNPPRLPHIVWSKSMLRS